MIKIVLNPGHKPSDDRGFLGTETEGGNNKKTVNLIKKYLEEYECEVLTVSQEDGTPFEKLGSKYPDATVFYSHHTNAFRGIGRGTEVFYDYGRTMAQNIAVRTAKILETVTREEQTGDNGAKKNRGRLAVINQAKRAGVKYQMLGEIGFHDNVKENKLMIMRRDDIAKAIAEEIAKFLNLKKKVVIMEKKLDTAQQWAVDNGIMRDEKWTEPATRSEMAWWLFDFAKKLKKGELK